MILQKSLEDEVSTYFKEDIKNKFDKFEVIEKIIPSTQVEQYKKDYPEGSYEDNLPKWLEKRGRRYFACERTRLLIPDIFVELEDGRRFIGDAKYYKDSSDANYDKEFYIYNDAQSNKYPMVVFAIPEGDNINRTTVPRNGYRRARIDTGFRELIIITVCVTDLINDTLSGTNKVLNDSINLIEKYTRKPEWQKDEY